MPKVSELNATAAVTAPTGGTLLLVTHAGTSGASTLGNLVKGSTAITSNNSGEINTVAAKTAPVTGDLLLVEDSAAANAKKKVTIGNLIGVVGPPPRTVVTTSSTTLSHTNARDGVLYVCNTSAAVTLTVPTAQTGGVTAEYLQATTNGQITVTGATGVSIRFDSATFNAQTAAQWSSLVVTIIDTNEALLRGDLSTV